MNLFFDEMSQKLIINAKKEMYDLKHPYVGSEHLLLAILHEDLDITKILNDFNINYDNFRNELIKIVGIGSKENNWFLFTPLLRRIINNATYYSKSSGIVTPYNLLVSILEEGDGVANRILIGMNINMNKLCDKFLSSESVVLNKTTKLDDIGINMNEASKKGKYDPVIGRAREIERIIQILLRKNKNNPLLIGEAGVGKTAIVEELARRISLGKVPYKLKDKVIYSISMSSLVAGTKYRGEFEEKINKLLDEAISNSNVILFIDEIHTLMGAGGAEGAIDASNIVKPYLARGDIKLIGATTIAEYSKYIEKDKALDRRFQKVYIEETSIDLLKNILYGLKNVYETYHRVILKKNILDKIIYYSNTAIFTGKQPDKAIDLLDEVCSYATVSNYVDNELFNIENKLIEIENKKNIEIKKHNFKKALIYRNREMNLRSEYNDMVLNNNPSKKVIITKDMIEKVICNRNGIIDRDILVNRFNVMRDKMNDKLLNVLLKYDFINNNKSLMVLLITKNVLDTALLIDKVAKNIFECNYIIIDMLEYKEYSSISRLIGTSSGYIGYDDEYVFQSIKENPFSIILFKNIDKADKRIMKIIYDSIERGYIENSKNEKINLTKCIIFMINSSNNNSIGFNDIKNKNNFNIMFDEIINFDLENIKN